MANNVGDLNIGVKLDTSSMNAGVKAIENNLKSLSDNIRDISSDMMSIGTSVAKKIVAPLLLLSGASTKIAGDFETIQVGFEGVTDGIAGATELMKELQTYSATTPFNFKDVAKSAKILLTMGYSTQDLNQQLRTLGDLSAGANVPLADMAKIMGKVKSKNKAMTEELLQMSERGVNILGELSKMYGVTKAEVLKMGSAGQITATTIENAFSNMTGTTGMFFNQTIKQSQTLNGKFSTLVDNIMLTANALGQYLLPIVKPIVDGLTKLLQIFISLPAPIKATLAAITALGLGLAGISASLLLISGGLGFLITNSLMAFKNFSNLRKVVTASSGKIAVMEILRRTPLLKSAEAINKVKQKFIQMKKAGKSVDLRVFNSMEKNAESLWKQTDRIDNSIFYLGESLRTIGPIGKKAFKTVTAKIAAMNTAVMATDYSVKSLYNTIIGKGIWSSITAGFSKTFSTVGAFLTKWIIAPLQGLWTNIISPIVTPILTFLASVISILGVIHAAISGVVGEWVPLDFYVSKFKNGLIVIASSLAHVAQIIWNIVKIVGNLFKIVLLGLSGTINYIVGGLMMVIKGSFQWITDNGGALFNWLISGFAKIGVSIGNSLMYGFKKAIIWAKMLAAYTRNDVAGYAKLLQEEQDLDSAKEEKVIMPKLNLTAFNTEMPPAVKKIQDELSKGVNEAVGNIKKDAKQIVGIFDKSGDSWFYNMAEWLTGKSKDKTKKDKPKKPGEAARGIDTGKTFGGILLQGALDTYQNELRLQGGGKNNRVDTAVIKNERNTRNIASAIKNLKTSNPTQELA